MAERPASVKTCGVCGETMNRTDRQPVCLPLCGHTFCRPCLVSINDINREIRCPTCRTLHRGAPPEELPVNWTLMDLLEPDEEEKKRNNTNSTEVPPRSTREAPTSNHSDLPGEPDPKVPPSRSDGSSSDTNNEKRNKVLKRLGIAAASVVGGVGLVAAAPVVLTGVGFTSAGIAAGSWAAGWMSAAAIANGGGIVAGSVVAVLQSAGAAGIGTAATATLGAAGAGGGAGIGYGISRLFRRSPGTNENVNSSDSGDNGDDNDSTSKGKKGGSEDFERRDQHGSPHGKFPPEGAEEGDPKDKDDDDTDSDVSDCEEKFSSMNLDATKDNQNV